MAWPLNRLQKGCPCTAGQRIHDRAGEEARFGQEGQGSPLRGPGQETHEKPHHAIGNLRLAPLLRERLRQNRLSRQGLGHGPKPIAAECRFV